MSRRRLPVVLATGAVAWSVALIGVAYLLPVYATESCGGSGGCTSGGATLVDVNGTYVVRLISVLVACTVIAWIGLHFRCAYGSRLGTVVAWAAAALMTGFSVISFGLGFFTLPMAGMMLAAAALTPTPRQASP
jgi:hypothetical protein